MNIRHELAWPTTMTSSNIAWNHTPYERRVVVFTKRVPSIRDKTNLSSIFSCPVHFLNEFHTNAVNQQEKRNILLQNSFSIFISLLTHLQRQVSHFMDNMQFTVIKSWTKSSGTYLLTQHPIFEQTLFSC